MGNRTQLAFALILLMVIVTAVEGSDKYSEVHASDVLDKIQHGDGNLIKYDNCIIEGELSLSDLIINRSVTFNNSCFQDKISAINVSFNKAAYFRNSIFKEDSTFSNSRFNGTVDFEGSRFSRNAHFLSTIFNEDSYFDESSFNETADFEGSRFYGDANFSGSTFNKLADFSSSFFVKRAYFGGLNPNYLTKFNGPANFSDIVFNGYASFDKSKFNETAYFNSSKFNDNAYFGFSEFNNFASFWNSRFKHTVFFTNSLCKNLDLTLAEYDKLYLHLSSKNKVVYNDRYGDTTYQLLIENFRKLGFYDDADRCYYQLRLEQLFHPSDDLTRYILDFGAWIFYGFGMRPEFPLIWSILVIIGSSVVFYITNGIRKPNAEDSPKIVYAPGYRSLHKPLLERIKKLLYQKRTISSGEALLLSATYFTSGASNIVSTQPSGFSTVGVSAYIAVLERLLGWFFFALFLAALNNTVIR